MTRQELAESMAEFVGVSFVMENTGDVKRMLPSGANRLRQVLVDDWDDYFYTPDGFFVVWDKLKELYRNKKLTLWQEAQVQSIWRMILWDKDDYTKFYSAIHEMKTTKEKVLNDQD